MIDRRSTRAYCVVSLCEEAAQQLQQAYGAWSLRFRCQRAEVKAMSSHRSPCSVRNRRRVVVCIFAAQQHLAPSDGGCDKPSAAEATTTIVGETGQVCLSGQAYHSALSRRDLGAHRRLDSSGERGAQSATHFPHVAGGTMSTSQHDCSTCVSKWGSTFSVLCLLCQCS